MNARATSRRSMALGFLGLGVAVLTVGSLFTATGKAHKLVTSRFTYNEDAFPIFRDKCASCHVKGGIAPMSLVIYQDALPWAESIRAELLAGRMPPWHLEEGSARFKHAVSLTPHEFDVLLEWSTAGSPEGKAENRPKPLTFTSDWSLGKPDLTLQMPAAFTLPADRMEQETEIALPTGIKENQCVRAVDLLPGNPQIVRGAEIWLQSPAASSDKTTGETLLAAWFPGTAPTALENGTGFRLPAGATLQVRMRYKKSFLFEGQALEDRSTVGVYFAPCTGNRELRAFTIAADKVWPEGTEQAGVNASGVLDQDVEAVAIRAEVDQPSVGLVVDATLPDGKRVSLLRAQVRPNWERRYWFDRPISLPRGSRIEIVAQEGELGEDLLGTPPSSASGTATGAPVRLTLDFVAVPSTRASR